MWICNISFRRKTSGQAVTYEAYQRKGSKREEYLHVQLGFKSQLIQSLGQMY